MAFVASQWYWEFTLVDRGNKRTVLRWAANTSPTTNDITSARAGFVDFRQNLAGVTACKFVSARLINEYRDNALTLPTSAEAELESVLQITAPIYGKPNKRALINIPGPVIAAFHAPTGDDADLANLAYTPLLQALQYFSGSEGGPLLVSDGEQIIRTQANGVRKHKYSKQG